MMRLWFTIMPAAEALARGSSRDGRVGSRGMPKGDAVVSLSARSNHACVSRGDGTVTCWRPAGARTWAGRSGTGGRNDHDAALAGGRERADERHRRRDCRSPRRRGTTRDGLVALGGSGGVPRAPWLRSLACRAPGASRPDRRAVLGGGAPRHRPGGAARGLIPNRWPHASARRLRRSRATRRGHGGHLRPRLTITGRPGTPRPPEPGAGLPASKSRHHPQEEAPCTHPCCSEVSWQQR
jgi:hypothetical protein